MPKLNDHKILKNDLIIFLYKFFIMQQALENTRQQAKFCIMFSEHIEADTSSMVHIQLTEEVQPCQIIILSTVCIYRTQ